MSNYRAPRGTQDLYGKEIEKWQIIEDKARKLCEQYHVKEMRTPIFEHTEVFKRGNDASDVVNKEMYTFEDRGNRSLTLKPEGTAGLIRSYVEHKMYAQGGGLQRYFYIAPNFRYERPQKGRMRIHHQFGVEFLGQASPYVDVEAMMLGLNLLDSIGLNQYKLVINTLGDQTSQDLYKKALRDHFSDHLETMCDDCKRRYDQNPLRMLDCKVDHDHEAMKTAPSNKDSLTDESKAYYAEVIQLIEDLGLDYEEDSRLVRGLDYYHHTVFEVISTDPKAGAQATLFAGGRYNHLVEYFGGPEISAFGFGMGIERLLVYADLAGIELEKDISLDVYGMPLDKDSMRYTFELIQKLRSLGYRADLDHENKSMRAQFKLADRYQAKIVILVGENEVKQKTVTLKNQETQEQITIPEDELVSKLGTWIGEKNE
ncbi:histidine--tRNA ligase [Erysipelothrix urinaevulpis]|uniref:histidine--tRNA ligase n=1 Tax=Erysipelothrix urinaevulpis TaxID=2683717 RepID=UPI00135893C7|nr:histidine--tRNA ligase [Erysipelothrix urinaevulpis]